MRKNEEAKLKTEEMERGKVLSGETNDLTKKTQVFLFDLQRNNQHDSFYGNIPVHSSAPIFKLFKTDPHQKKDIKININSLMGKL